MAKSNVSNKWDAEEEFSEWTPEELAQLRMASMGPMKSGMGEQSSPDMSPDDVSPVDYAARAQADQAKMDALAAQSNAATGKLSAAGDATTAAGAMGANPYVAGAGLALKTLGAVDDAKRQAEQAKINAYNQKIMAQRSAVRNLFE